MNVELATTCGMLHDIYPVITGHYEKHAVRGGEQAETLLKTTTLYSDEEIKIVTTAVSRHSSKNKIQGPYDEVLKDADVMHHCLYNANVPVRENEIERYKSLLVELGYNPA